MKAIILSIAIATRPLTVTAHIFDTIASGLPYDMALALFNNQS